MWTGPQVLDLPCLGLQLCLGGVALVPAPDPQLRLAAGLAGMVLQGGAHQHAQPGHCLMETLDKIYKKRERREMSSIHVLILNSPKVKRCLHLAACARRMNNDMYRESTEPEQTNVNRTIASLVTRSVQETVQVDDKWQNREQTPPQPVPKVS